MGRMARTGILAAIIAATPGAAWSDAGLPMLAVAWPAMWACFVPIFLVEAAVASRLLRGRRARSLAAVLAANVVSTLVGIPVTWAALVATALLLSWLLSVAPSALESILRWALAPFFIAWLGPGAERHFWWIATAFLGLLVPFFLMSVWVERRVVGAFKLWPVDSVRAWSWQANMLSYGVLGVLSLGTLLWARLLWE